MSSVRYQVDGVPQDERSHAFFPVPGLTPQGQFSIRGTIHGYPGTMQVPMGDAQGSGTLSNNPEWSPWSDDRVSPNWIAPQLWWNDINARSGDEAFETLAPPVHYMPHRIASVVPPVGKIDSLSELGPSPVAMSGRKIGGLRSMKWPRAIIRWPNLRGEY